MHNLEMIKNVLNNPDPSVEDMESLIEELRIFFQVLRVKVESKDTSMCEDVFKDLADLKLLLERHPAVLAEVMLKNLGGKKEKSAG